MNRLDDRRGSALIATVIIAGTVALILAGIARFTIVQLKTATSLEDGTVAYAAAEAGIEEGLLRWRYDRNVELPVADMQAVMPGTPAERVDLTAGTDPAVVEANSPLPPVTDSSYDLRIWYKASSLGDPAHLNDPTYPYRISKDQSISVDVSNLRGEILQLSYAVPTGYQARLEVSVVTQGGCPTVDGVTPDLCEVSKQLYDPSTGSTIPVSIPSGTDQNPYSLRIRPFIFRAGTTTAADSTTYITYAIRPTKSSASLIDTGTTFIESTGYFGTAKRELVAKVDRSSGTVLGIYDYALFAKESIGQ